MSDISPSAIKTDRSIEEAISKATSQAEVQQILRDAAVNQGVVRPDIYDPNVLLEVAPGTVPRGYAKTVIVNGLKHILEGSTEAELLQAENALYRAAVQPATTQQTEQPRDTSTGRFTSSAEPIVSDEQKAALQLQFQLGQISASEYIEKSGAVSEYLEKAGIPVEELKAQVQEKQSERVTQSWQSATQEFLNSPAGNWWPGGEINMEKIGKVLIEMEAEDEPSAENLRRAAEYLRDSNQLVEPPEVAERNRALEAARIIGEVTDPYTLREMLQPGTSGLFGR